MAGRGRVCGQVQRTRFDVHIVLSFPQQPMPRSLALLSIGLFFGGGIGFFLAAANNVALDGHHHPSATGKSGQPAGHAHHGPHDGRAVALPAGPDAPTLHIRVTKDAADGWNLNVVTTNFRFAPERVNAPHRAGEGHAHVYIDGRKIARLYGSWFHLGALPPGKVTVAVTLNANDHSELTVAGQPLRAEKTILAE